MKKTLLVTIDYPPAVGGVASYWKQVADSLPADKLVVLTKGLLFRWLWPRWIKGIWTVYRSYKKHGCQQILVGQVLPVGSMALVLHRLFKTPYFVQVYGMDLLMAKRSARKYRLAKKILLSAEMVFTNTDAVGKIVEEYCKDIKHTTIYPVPVALLRYRAGPVPKDVSVVDEAIKQELISKHQLDGKKVILTIGRLVERKGQDIVIEAMKKIQALDGLCPSSLQTESVGCKTVYVIVGDGPDRQRLQAMADKDQVIFTGRVDDTQRNAWLSICDVFIMVARQTKDDIEGFGMVYLEANQLGKPVIAGRSGGVPEAVIHEKTGLLVDPENVDEVVGAIAKLLNDPELSSQLGQQGRERLRIEMTWEKSVELLQFLL